eukprot:TRINITY_DN3526_c0_g1_i2.p1 TRINITY_DN3526_c0_g1~~TRINITY_DN3526_c0_g1_i2.p1  ORF type:complete len:469 (+),score=168.00 TRINITY_DN3526_c0_g1_i2:74-1480(+)
MVKVKNVNEQEEREFRSLFDGIDGVSVQGQTLKPILAGVQNTVHVMLDTKTYSRAFEENEKNRKPIYGCIVLDVSGSMNGSPLRFCKEAIKQISQVLKPGDQFDLVTYGDDARVEVPGGCTYETRARFDAMVDNLSTRGMTNMSAGLDLGMTMVSQRNDKELSPHIFLFSDGKVNRGVTSQQDLGAIAKTYAQDSGVTIHALGIGESYDEKLMKHVAREGNNGVFFNIASSEAIPEAVEKCFEGVSRTLGQHALLKVKGLGHAVVRQGLYGAKKDNVATGFRIGALRHMGLVRKVIQLDIAIPANEAEQAEWVDVSATDAMSDGQQQQQRIPLLECQVQYQDPASGNTVLSPPFTIHAHVVHTHEEADKENVTVRAFMDMKEMEENQAEMYRDIENGRIEEAKKKKSAFDIKARRHEMSAHTDIAIKHQAKRFQKISVSRSAKSKKAMWSTAQEADDIDEDMGYGLFA